MWSGQRATWRFTRPGVAGLSLPTADSHQPCARRRRRILPWAVPVAWLRLWLATLIPHTGTHAGPRPDPRIWLPGDVHHGCGRSALPAVPRDTTRPSSSGFGGWTVVGHGC